MIMLLPSFLHSGRFRATRRRPLLLGSSLLIALLTTQTKAQVPHGVFSLKGAGGYAIQTVLANPDVLGISVRQDWAQFEPNEYDFSWTYLDMEVQAATDAGKQVLLRINTQAAKPSWVTQAIQDAGGTFFTFDDNGVSTTIPVFWDPTYLAKKKDMSAALGAHFGGNPTVTNCLRQFRQCYKRRLECAAYYPRCR